MTHHTNWKEFVRRATAVLGAAMISALAPVAAQAGQSAAPTCNALISIANNPYLVTSSGKTITQFTSDGAAKGYVAISPNGSKVVYTTQGSSETTYEVVDTYGRQGSYRLYSPQIDHNSSASGDYGAKGALMGLSWSSNDVIRLEKHVSPTASRFEFHRINKDLTGTAPLVGSAGSGDSCSLARNGDRLACVQEGEDGAEGDIVVDGKGIFSESKFKGVSPLVSYSLAKGESINTPGNPSFKVQVLGFHKKSVGLKITLSNGLWEKMYVPKGLPLTVPGVQEDYAFFATITNANSGLVRVEEVKIPASESTIFDPAIAWQPHGPGLLLIRRAGNQATLNLIQPRENGEHSHRGRGRGHEWSLVAKTPIDMPNTVQMMRFITPSMLLLQTENGQFDEVFIHIANGSENGRPAMTVRGPKPMPATIAVTRNGKTTQATVLGWSCKAPHGDDDDND